MRASTASARASWSTPPVPSPSTSSSAGASSVSMSAPWSAAPGSAAPLSSWRFRAGSRPGCGVGSGASRTALTSALSVHAASTPFSSSRDLTKRTRLRRSCARRVGFQAWGGTGNRPRASRLSGRWNGGRFLPSSAASSLSASTASAGGSLSAGGGISSVPAAMRSWNSFAASTASSVRARKGPSSFLGSCASRSLGSFLIS
mmetsp:Transcript_8130/g.32883  ORF Transcript_8130/g.32883 Transcript_8130/m.32883 type:complete len:202 (-) Transcript_8130:560-1165(-)